MPVLNRHFLLAHINISSTPFTILLMMRHLKKIVFISWGLASNVWAIDLLPGDVVAPKPGINLLQFTYQRSERGDYYKNNAVLVPNKELVNTQLQVKYGRSFEIQDLPAFFYLQTPYTDIKATDNAVSLLGLSDASGVGDTTFALAIWPYANHNTRRYLGVAGYLTTPTGDYQNQRAVNPGENRYKWAGQIGYQQPIYKDVDWMVAFDTLWFGKNSDYKVGGYSTLEQKPLYSLQTSVLYQLNHTYAATLAYFYSSGAVSYKDNARQSDQTVSQRYQASLIANVPMGKVILQYGQEISTKSGFKEESRWLLRYNRYFK